MENFKNLIINYKHFIENVLISESELYCNYFELCLTEEEQQKENSNEIIEQKILSDILYDFIFNISKIKDDLINATEFFYEDYSKNETLKIYKQIKTIFKDFYIEDLEEYL